jgi:hypothetical protein
MRIGSLKLSSATTGLFCVVIGLLSSSSIHAFPSGAGGCDGGMAAVEGAHLTANAVTGTLADGGFDLIVNGQFKLEPSTLTSLELDKEYKLSIQGSGPFRGILIRMEGEGITMTPESDFQLASVCDSEGAVGITHTDSSDKSELTPIGSFVVTTAQDLQVDVTIVVSNNGQDGSEYYYNSYLLETVDELPSDVPLPDTIPPVANGTVLPTPEVTMGTTTIAPTGGNDTSVPPETSAPTPAATMPPTSEETSGPGDMVNGTDVPVTESPAEEGTEPPSPAETDSPTLAPSSVRETSFYMATASSLALAWMVNVWM